VARAEIYRASRQDKPWGHELIFAAVEGKYAGKIIYVQAGQSLSLQYHREKEETISVLSGEALLVYGPAADQLTARRPAPGDGHYRRDVRGIVNGRGRLAGGRRPAAGRIRPVGHQRAVTLAGVRRR
jgi:hypothetical protein